jgi:hypothetical protein
VAIRVNYASNNQLAGYVSKDLNEFGVHRVVINASDALRVSLEVPPEADSSPVNVIENNLANFTDIFYLAGTASYYTLDNNLEPGTNG